VRNLVQTYRGEEDQRVGGNLVGWGPDARHHLSDHGVDLFRRISDGAAGTAPAEALATRGGGVDVVEGEVPAPRPSGISSPRGLTGRVPR